MWISQLVERSSKYAWCSERCYSWNPVHSCEYGSTLIVVTQYCPSKPLSMWSHWKKAAFQKRKKRSRICNYSRPKQTEKSENARKREDQVDRVWLAVSDRDCHFSTPTKMLGSNVNSYREANIVLNHTDQISYAVYQEHIRTWIL